MWALSDVRRLTTGIRIVNVVEPESTVRKMVTVTSVPISVSTVRI